METTFYEDQFMMTDMKSLKRPVTLDLDSPVNSKKQRIINPILTSPDVNMLKLASPELERFIMAQQGTITTTPTPTQYLFSTKNVTEEQEQYARGFVDALAQLHQTSAKPLLPQGSEILPNSIASSVSFSIPSSTSVASTFQPLSSINQLYGGMALPVQLQAAASSSVFTAQQATSSTASVTRPSSVDSSSSSSYPGCLAISVPSVTVKEEPQTVPSDCSGITPPLSPIDMEDQERIKLERKRYRNRIAASKCRRRKLERIAKLEDKVKDLKNENAELAANASKLREQVCHLKEQVLNHVKSGCQILVAQHFL